MKKKPHGILVLKFDTITDPTLEDFKTIFRFNRSFFKDYPIDSTIVIGEVTYDKDDFTERIVYINDETHRIRFNKRNEINTFTDEQELEWRKSLQTIYGKGWSGQHGD